MTSSRLRAAAKGMASLSAAVANLVQAGEVLDDILNGTKHFAGPRCLKIVAWVVLMIWGLQEIEKMRHSFEEVTT